MKVIKINALWCSACLIMNHVWDEIIKEHPIETTTLDYDFDSTEVMKYQPGNVLPVFIFFSGNREIFRLVGEKKKQEVLNLIERLEDSNEENHLL